MWALINSDNSIAEIIRFPRNITINNVQHSRKIFTTWSWADLNAIGIYQVVDSGTKGDDRFQYTSQPTYTFNADDNNVTTSYTITEKNLNDVNEVWSQEEIDDGQAPDGTNANDAKLDIDGNQMVTVGLKTQAKEQAKRTAHDLIKRFGWLVQRVTMDSSQTIPSAVTTYCANIRTDCADIITAIDNASDMTAFKALYQDTYNYDSDGEITSVNTVARVNRWSDDTNVQQYVR